MGLNSWSTYTRGMSNIGIGIRIKHGNYDINNNRTYVNWEVYAYRVAGYNWYENPTSYINCTINGSKVVNNKACLINVYKQTSHTLARGGLWVGHNSDGKKSIRYNFSLTKAPYPINTGSVSGTYGLPTIPRASSMSISKSSMNYGDRVTFSISRASSRFQHIINGNWGAGSKNMMSKRSGTSFTWTLPNSYMNNIPNSTSKKATIWLDTYSGDKKIGTKTYYITGNVPSSVIPTVDSITAYDRNDISRNLMNASNQFIQGVSDIRIDNNGGNGVYGSSTTQRQFVSPNGSTVTTSSSTWQYFSGITNVTGTKTLSTRIKDSRGRWSAWKNVSVTIYAYSAPQLNSFSIARLSAGTTLQIKAKGSISSLNGKNSYNLWVDTSDKGRNSWTNRYNYKTGTSFDVTANISGSYDVAKSYDIRVNLTDKLGNTQRLTSIGTIKKILTVRRNIGIGIGKIHEQGALDVGGDIYLSGKVYGSLYPQSNVTDGNAGASAYLSGISLTEGNTLSGVPEGYGVILNSNLGAYRFSQTLICSYTSNTYVRHWRETERWTKWCKVATDVNDVAPQGMPGSWFRNGFGDYSSGQRLWFRRENKTCYLYGTMKNDRDWSGGTDNIVFANVPSQHRPPHKSPNYGQGTGTNTFYQEVNSSGDCQISRYQNGGSYSTLKKGSWLNISLCWPVE
ncbi:MAG TPA: hypothetical protein DIW15_00305 [Bavariicoccus seileri]|uniref:Uncharacterized protein n=1 Tax=Bavariicoccus seileri TaxID=549685 RepID=A0A3D4S3D6_9ENTE|nr:DUF859 family phage minor structural protein [Bavariicoccus seileri]HCS93136.1 hypothetical protein [Bavariicoccus seileri]